MIWVHFRRRPKKQQDKGKYEHDSLFLLPHSDCKKMKFSNKYFFSKCHQIRRNPKEIADFVTFTEEILNGKLHFLYSVIATSLFIYHLKTSENQNVLSKRFRMKKKKNYKIDWKKLSRNLLRGIQPT